MSGQDIAQHLGNIQGNILSGFNKDYQTLLFFQIPNPASGRVWLREVSREISATADVHPFNQRFKSESKRLRRDPVLAGLMKATWVNLAFTYQGLVALGAAGAEDFPPEFKLGMSARAELLGDIGKNAPEFWLPALRYQNSHGMLHVAADHEAECGYKARRLRDRMARSGLTLLYTQEGRAREGSNHGHEHFGFKDGISQPDIRGLPYPYRPPQSDPYLALMEPGEFVLGYPTERSGGATPTVRPEWAADGSFLVFRRLRQDVQGFQDFINRQCKIERISADLMGAKILGRYQSGAPLETVKDQSRDPGSSSKYADDAHVNDFNYRDDPDGRWVPRAAHIRKAYPRDQMPPGAPEANLHRIIRRGIPYGRSYVPGSPPRSAEGGDADRGLLFLCYQRSIANQFEYVQQQMVNNPNFPVPGDGLDPLISQSTGEFSLPGGVSDHVALMRRWVTTTGGEYLFSPSISALRKLSAGQ